jgi:DNA-binding transcriptional regulator YdaS (Cro superfamily)
VKQATVNHGRPAELFLPLQGGHCAGSGKNLAGFVTFTAVGCDNSPVERAMMGDRKAISNLGRRKRAFDEDEVLCMLRAAVEREGSQKAFAKRHGLNRSNLNLVLSGKRPVTDSVARTLGLCRLYVAAEDQTFRMLRAAIEREGGQSAFARRHGLDRSNLNLVLSGKRPVTDAVARPLGLCGLYVAD